MVYRNLLSQRLELVPRLELVLAVELVLSLELPRVYRGLNIAEQQVAVESTPPTPWPAQSRHVKRLERKARASRVLP